MSRKSLIVVMLMVVAMAYGVSRAGRPVRLAGSVSEGPPAAASAARPPAPDFRLTDLEGQPLTMSALHGKVVLLDFWATWCPPCREEIPHFKALYADYRAQGFDIVGLALDDGGAAVVRPFVAQHRIAYPIAMGTDEVAEAYGGIRGIPTTFLIDKRGNIAEKYVGARAKAVFERDIRRLLAE